MDENNTYERHTQALFQMFDEITRALAGSPHDIYEVYEQHPGTSWELRDDLMRGRALFSWNRLDTSSKDSIRHLVDAADCDPCSHDDLQDLMSPYWQNLRKLAKDYVSATGMRKHNA